MSLCYDFFMSEGTAKYISSFSMGLQHLERFNERWYQLDEAALSTWEGDVGFLKKYIVGLEWFYLNFKPLVVSKHKAKELDDLFNAVKDLEHEYYIKAAVQNVIPVALIEKCKELHGKLWELAQVLNLGLDIQKHESQKRRVNRAFMGEV